jgi:hypothetical protein
VSNRNLHIEHLLGGFDTVQAGVCPISGAVPVNGATYNSTGLLIQATGAPGAPTSLLSEDPEVELRT